MMRRKYLAGLLLTAMAPTIAACGDGEGHNKRKLLPAAQRAVDLDAETQRVRDMQRVKYVRHDADGSTEIVDEDVSALKHDIFRRCTDDLPLHTSTCANGVAAYRATLCQAEALLAAAKARATPLTVPSTNPDSQAYVEIPQQSHAVNAKLAKMALEKIISIYTNTQDFSGRITYDYHDYCTDVERLNQHWRSGLGFGRIGDTLIEVYRRAYEVGEEAAYLASENMIAVSDAERSSIFSTRTSGWRAWNQRDLSRIAAAQIIVGGAMPDGLWEPDLQFLAEPVDFPDGFCPNRPLSAAAQRATQLLRAAAPPTGWIMEPSISTKDILDGGLYDTPDTGTVAKRLAELYRDPDLASTSDLAGHFGLTLEDFEEARRYLVDEIKAFARDTSERLPATPGGTYYPYSALRVARNDAPDGFYVALAVGSGNAMTEQGGTVFYPTSLSFMRQAAKGRSDSLVDEANNSGQYGFDADEAQVLLGVAGTLKESAITAEPGLFSLTRTGAWYQADTDTSTRQYRLVMGEQALTCATQGIVEGRACSQTELTNYTIGTLVDSTSFCPVTRCLYATFWDQPLEPNRRYYLVREITEGLSGPGRFELVAVTEYRQIGGTGDIPAASADYAYVAKIMRPSKQWCNHPRISCSGASFDERLPLEDELTNDQDGVESSWKHYLALAKQAAQEADELGTAYVTAGLDVDRNISETSIREEQKRQQLNSVFETVQNTCGTKADVKRIVDLIMGKPGGSCTSNSSCKGVGLVCSDGKCQTGYRTCSDDSTCGTGFCANGICIPSFRQFGGDPDMQGDLDVQRLVRCITSDLYEFVGIGDSPLCVSGISGNAYCTGGNSESSPCPRPTKEQTGCEAGEVFVHRDDSTLHTGGTELLNMFHQRDVPPEDTAEVCEAIVTLRSGGSRADRQAALSTIQSSRVMLPENVRDVAKRIGFEGRIGAYAAITLNGTTIFHTGANGVGPNYGQWPCAAQNAGSMPAQTGALWSQLADCSDEMQRGAINDRLMRAVTLARIVGGNPANSTDMQIPVWQNWSPGPTDANSSRTVWDNTSTSNNGVVTEVDRSQPNEWREKLYITQDQNALSLTAYVTRLNGNLVAVPVQGKVKYGGGSASDAWFGFANAPTMLLTWSDSADKLPSPYWTITTNSTGTTFATRDAPVIRDDRISGKIGLGESRSGFPEVTPDQMFRGVSTLIDPEKSNSVADAWYLKQLKHLVEGRPVESIPAHVLNHATEEYGSHGRKYSTGGLALHDPVRLTGDGLLDAMEVLCRGRIAAVSGARPNLNTVPVVSSPADLPNVKAYMEDVAKRIEDWASRFVIPKFPKVAADYLRAESNAGVVPELGGTYATTMTTLRGALIEMAQVGPLMAFELRQLATAIEQARIVTAQSDISAQMAELDFESQMANNAAACLSAAASMDAKLSFGASAAVSCANAIVQGIIAAKQLSLKEDSANLEKQGALNSFQEQLNTHAQALHNYADRISKALEDIDGTIAELERQRLATQRALAEAIRLAAFTPASADNIAAALVRQRETTRLRYVQSFENAKRMAFLAKRSIEQRLGVLMADLTEDMPLVEAPASWESTVCDRSGVDYQKVRSINANAPTNYADAFIGDYVSKLERVVESYRLENNFHEGVDTAVISLRDDVLNVKAPCAVSSKNLLSHTGDLDMPAAADGTNGWRATGCLPRTDAQGGVLPPLNCVTVMPTNEKGNDEIGPYGSARVYRLFGGKVTRAACATGECDYQAASAWAQHISLGAGVYRVSYLAPACTSSCNQSNVEATLVDSVTGPMTVSWNNWRTITGDKQTWRHLFAIVRLNQAQDLEIEFRPSDKTVTGYPGVFAAPMVERIEPTLEDQDHMLFPPQIITTSEGNSVSMNTCEDTTGAIFRATAWSMGELPLCPDGFAGSCSPEKVQNQRFWQIPFSIYQRDIEAGRILTKAGFARGNFNYRIESVALNFVGTGVRNCATSDSPSTCYSSGYVPYSLDHIGPYTVRNHFGGDFEAKLFTGHIEHARGLAAERFITNPVSSSDQQLLEPFTRNELQGRPLDGNFIVRLWQEPGVYFDGIEDIQVILKYRYWTRFD